MKKSTPRNAIQLLREIQNGAIKAQALASTERRLCIEQLHGGGYSATEMSEILSVSTRTIHRDVLLIREAHAVEASPQVTRQSMGQMLLHSNQAIARLQRIARDSQTPAADQVHAVNSAWQIEKERIELLQKLGILPLAAQEIHAQVEHLPQDPRSLEDLVRDVAVIEAACRHKPEGHRILNELVPVRGLLAQAQAALLIDSVKPNEVSHGSNEAQL